MVYDIIPVVTGGVVFWVSLIKSGVETDRSNCKLYQLETMLCYVKTKGKRKDRRGSDRDNSNLKKKGGN